MDVVDALSFFCVSLCELRGARLVFSPNISPNTVFSYRYVNVEEQSEMPSREFTIGEMIAS